MPELDRTGLTFRARLILPSGQELEVKGEVVALLPTGAGLAFSIKPDLKHRIAAEVAG